MMTLASTASSSTLKPAWATSSPQTATSHTYALIVCLTDYRQTSRGAYHLQQVSSACAINLGRAFTSKHTQRLRVARGASQRWTWPTGAQAQRVHARQFKTSSAAAP